MSSSFRLGRLLGLRRREERAAKLRWAAAARDVAAAGARREEGRADLTRAQDELAGEYAAAPSPTGEGQGARLAAHVALDALVERKVQDEDALLAARNAAAAARAPYDAFRREVEALERLESRWRRERRRRRRRREDRERDEIIARTEATKR
ncbi:MAG: flagellar FliJ family protein [Planctomycetota bacterium]